MMDTREIEELVEQGPFLIANGLGFQLEDNAMREYDKAQAADHRYQTARSTGIGWRGHHESLAQFHDRPLGFVGWFAIIALAGAAVVILGLMHPLI